MHHLQVGTLQHIASDKKSKLTALKKLGDAGVPVNSRITAHPPKEEVCLSILMPRRRAQKPMGTPVSPDALGHQYGMCGAA